MMNFDKFLDKDLAKDKINDVITTVLAQTKLNEILHKEEPVKEEPKKSCNVIVIILAVIGAIAAVAGIAFCVYKFMFPDYLEEFEDEEFDDETEDEEE